MFVLSYASFGGRTSLESPTMHLVVGGLFRMRAWCRGVSSNRKRSGVLAGQATSEAERVNAVHVSSFQENRKFSSTKAKYGNCVTCHHVAHSLSLFLYGLFPVPLEDAILRVCHAFFSRARSREESAAHSEVRMCRFPILCGRVAWNWVAREEK